MREFGFGKTSDVERWWLHIQCSWRLEMDERVITGSFDWNQPASIEGHGPDWDPATGGSIQETKLRDVFKDYDPSRRTLRNNTDLLTVEHAEVNELGDLTLTFTGGTRLRVFPAGCNGEFWRIFKKGDLESHFVCEGKFGAGH
jgi:hypothetical protein